MAEHAQSLSFEQEPDYNYLKFYFEKNIMELDIVPSIHIDWEPKRLIKSKITHSEEEWLKNDVIDDLNNKEKEKEIEIASICLINKIKHSEIK